MGGHEQIVQIFLFHWSVFSSLFFEKEKGKRKREKKKKKFFSCLFFVFLDLDVVHLSFYFQVLWPSIIVINRGCWCRSVCFRTSSRTYLRVPSGCVFENLTLCAFPL